MMGDTKNSLADCAGKNATFTISAKDLARIVAVAKKSEAKNRPIEQVIRRMLEVGFSLVEEEPALLTAPDGEWSLRTNPQQTPRR